MDKLTELKSKIEEFQAKSAFASDMKSFMAIVLKVIKDTKDNVKDISDENQAKLDKVLAYLEQEHANLLENVDVKVQNVSQETTKLTNEIREDSNIIKKDVSNIKDTLTTLKSLIDEISFEEEFSKLSVKINEVENKIPKTEELAGETIVDKINALSLEEENKIDASHIKNLPATTVKGGGVRLLQYLADVNIQSPANNDVLKYNSTSKLWENGTGGGSGSGDVTGPASSTDNALARFDGLTGKIIQNSSGTLDDTGILSITSAIISGTNGNGHINLRHQASDASATGQSTALFADSNGDLKWKNDGDFYTTLKSSTNTADRVYTFPDTTGTVALTSDLSSYQPLDADLTAIAGLSPSNDDILQRKAGAWTNRTMAQLKTDLVLTKSDVGLSNVDNTSDATKNSASVTLTNKTIALGSNTISGTKAQFDTAVTDGNFLYVGDITQYTDELAQDAVGGILTNSTFINLIYSDATPSITASLNATGTPSSSTYLRGDNTWATIGGGGDVTKVGTPVNNQIGVWTGDGTIEGDVDLVYDSTVKRLTIGSNTAGAGDDAVLRIVDNDGTVRLILDSDNATDSYWNGILGIGKTSLTRSAYLELGGGTTTIAPLIITAGTNLTTPVNGAIENNGTHLYYTTGGVRYQLDQQSGSGTVTSVAMTVPTGLTISGSPVTTSGTLAVALDTGYVIPLQSTLDGYVKTDQTVGQTIGTTGARLTKLWATDITVTNAISGSITGNAGTVTNGVYTTGAGSVFEVPLTFSTGLTRTTNTITVNTTQNIAKLSNLTSNGFVKTSGGDGTLSIDTNTYLTGNQTITLSGDITGSGATSITTTISAGAVDIAMLSATGTPSSSTYLRGDNTWATVPSLSDGDKGDITVSSSGTVWTIDNGVVSLAKQADVATGTIFYRKTAGTGSPEVQTLATLKTDLGLTGTNSGDVTVLDSSEIDFTLTGQQITASLIAGSIANSKLTNSSITIAGTSTALGASISQDTITGLSSTGIIKRTGANTLAIATSGTDYAPATSGTSILKGNGSGGFSNASAGTDYVAPGAVTSSGLTMATARLLGRSTASTGAIEEISIGSGLSLSAGTLSASGGSGESVSKSISQTSHGFAVGDVLKYSGSTYAKAQADSSTNAEVVGIVSAVADANTFTLLTAGYISTLSGLTANTTYFLSPSSAGALTSTEPSTAGQVSKPLLRAVSTTAGYFVNMRGVTISATVTTVNTSVDSTQSTYNTFEIDFSGSGSTPTGDTWDASAMNASTRWNGKLFRATFGTNSYISQFLLGNIGNSSNFLQFGNGKDIIISFNAKFSSASGQVGIGIADSTDVFYSASTSAGKLMFTYNGTTLNAVNGEASNTTTDVGSGITKTNWNNYRIVYTYGTNVKFYINNTLVATHTTNLPTSSSNARFGIGGATSGNTAELSNVVISIEQ